MPLKGTAQNVCCILNSDHVKYFQNMNSTVHNLLHIKFKTILSTLPEPTLKLTSLHLIMVHL